MAQMYGSIHSPHQHHHEKLLKVICELPHREHCKVGWTARLQSICPDRVRDAAILHATSARIAGQDAARLVRQGQKLGASPGYVAWRCMEASQDTSQRHHSELASQMLKSSEPSWDCRPGADLGATYCGIRHFALGLMLVSWE